MRERAAAFLPERRSASYNVLLMSPLEDVLARIASKKAEERSTLPITLDLVGAYEAAELLGIGARRALGTAPLARQLPQARG